MSAVVDSSFLIALLNEDDAHHSEARRRYDEEGPQLVNQPVLTELLRYVHFKARKEGGDRAGHDSARQALALVLRDLRFRVVPLEDQEGVLPGWGWVS